MAVTAQSSRWEELFAARTRADVGDGIAHVLAFLGVPGLISFAGGFPDPLTFPRERTRTLLAEFAESGEVEAFQYAPTRGLAGPLDAVAGRTEALQGRRPADDELMLTSGAIEALDLIGKTFLDRGDTVAVEAFQYAPTRGLAGPLHAVAGRLDALQGRRPADDELLLTSGAIEALDLIGKTFLD